MNASPLTAVDAPRAWALRALGAPLRPLLRDRALRVLVYGLLAVSTSFVFAYAAPVELLLVGPLLLGVPHVLADLRYLVAKRGLHRRVAFWGLVALPACASWVRPSAAVGLLALAGGALAARAPWRWRLPVLASALACAGIAARTGPLADVLFAHAHNVVALVLFVLWARAHARHAVPIVLLFSAGCAAILAGVADHTSIASFSRGALDPQPLVVAMAPVGPSQALLGVRLVTLFAFAQSVHYAVWLRLVPEEDRERPGLRPFASSMRALRADLGAPLLAAAALLAAAFIAWGVVSASRARTGYLQLVLFHGPLELGAAAMLLLERAFPRSR
jgi:hypothetical protein